MRNWNIAQLIANDIGKNRNLTRNKWFVGTLVGCLMAAVFIGLAQPHLHTEWVGQTGLSAIIGKTSVFLIFYMGLPLLLGMISVMVFDYKSPYSPYQRKGAIAAFTLWVSSLTLVLPVSLNFGSDWGVNLAMTVSTSLLMFTLLLKVAQQSHRYLKKLPPRYHHYVTDYAWMIWPAALLSIIHPTVSMLEIALILIPSAVLHEEVKRRADTTESVVSESSSDLSLKAS